MLEVEAGELEWSEDESSMVKGTDGLAKKEEDERLRRKEQDKRQKKESSEGPQNGLRDSDCSEEMSAMAGVR